MLLFRFIIVSNTVVPSRGFSTILETNIQTNNPPDENQIFEEPNENFQDIKRPYK